MTQDRTARATTAPSVPLPLVALLALAALLMGIFVIHSEATGHDMTGPMAASAAPQLQTDEAVGMSLLALTNPAVATLASGTHEGLLSCALLAMTCGLLLILAMALMLFRRPTTYRRLLDAGGAALGVTRRSDALPVRRPSLIQLSISRV